MTNPKIIGMVLIVAAAASVLLSTQNSVAIIDVPLIVEEETVEGGNASMMADQTATNGNIAEVQFLAIQRAQSGSISEINATTYTLSLNNESDDTILFSDRPERIVETISTADFIGNWNIGPDSFAADAPNDALIVEDIQTGELETAIIESFNPVYDTNTNALTYTITTENATSINLPSQFGESILVIDFRGCVETDGDCFHRCETFP